MSRRCELTGIGPMVGHNVSHSNIKTKRRFLPALSPASLQSDSLGQTFKLRISNAHPAANRSRASGWRRAVPISQVPACE